jgi:choline dehydrogenase-like flavoprotein
MSEGRHRVIVVGGGFGGIRVARALARSDADITIVDRTNHHLFLPLLYQVEAGPAVLASFAPKLQRYTRRDRLHDVGIRPRALPGRLGQPDSCRPQLGAGADLHQEPAAPEHQLRGCAVRAHS